MLLFTLLLITSMKIPGCNKPFTNQQSRYKSMALVKIAFSKKALEA